MTIFTDADLDDFSVLATELALKDDCEILGEVSSDDDGEGGTENDVWQVVETVKGILVDDSQTPTESVVAGRLDGRTLQKVLLPRGTNVQKTNRLRINGTTYHIMDVSTNSYEVLKAVEVWREF